MPLRRDGETHTDTVAEWPGGRDCTEQDAVMPLSGEKMRRMRSGEEPELEMEKEALPEDEMMMREVLVAATGASRRCAVVRAEKSSTI